MSFLIRIVAAADGTPCPEAGCYVRQYTPDGYDGRGRMIATARRELARLYPDAVAAWADWRRVSATHPRRPDGKPNRPLTAYTVELVQV